MCAFSLCRRRIHSSKKRMRRKSMGETAAAWLDWGMRNHGEKSTRKSACDPKGTQATPPTIAISALICHFVFVLFVSACKNIVFCLYIQTFVCFSFKKVSESSVFGTFLMSTSFRQSRCSVVLLMCGLRSGGCSAECLGCQSGRFTSELTMRTS